MNKANRKTPPRNIIKEEISEDTAMQMLKKSVNNKAISEAGSWLETQEEKFIKEMPKEASWHEDSQDEIKEHMRNRPGEIIITGTGGDIHDGPQFKRLSYNPKFRTIGYKEAMETRDKIERVLHSLEKLLIEKNKRYGNSALEPLEGIKYTPEDGIKIRLTDKLKRVINSDNLRKNDIADIMGYLTLLCVSKGWTDFNDLID